MAVVDDSIVRGTTSKRLVNLFRKAGAEKVYFISAAPPIEHPCIYGIDMASRTELIAGNGRPIHDICTYLEADALIYLPREKLKELYPEHSMCYACFSGEYPTGHSDEILQDIEQERIASQK